MCKAIGRIVAPCGLLLATIFTCIFPSFVSAEDESKSPKGKISAYEIFDRKEIPLGDLGSGYRGWEVKAAIDADVGTTTESEGLLVLRAIFDAEKHVVQKNKNAAYLRVLLYMKKDHIFGTIPIGDASWGPRGHSFATENVSNIENKSTYEDDVRLMFWPREFPNFVARIPESTRFEISVELTRSQDRAAQDTDEKYHLMGIKKSSPDEFREFNALSDDEKKKRFDDCYRELDRLKALYREQVLSKYGITGDELHTIEKEAFAKVWPIP